MAENDSLQGTQLAGAQVSVGATIMAGGRVDTAALRQAEQAVAVEWKPGDVILDLYEVRKVTEGFGEDAVEKDYHEGGFGRVYKIWHRGWNMELAVKVPRPDAYNTLTKKENFLRECESWINLDLHPHVATCNYVRELGAVPRVFSEYAAAGTLEDWITSGRLYEGGESAALERILDVAIQFAWGLHHAHEHRSGMVHQDVKPLNLLMMVDSTAKVCDFGTARARALPPGEGTPGAGGGQHSILVTGGGGYTPAYCSPEQLAGQPLSRRTDMWSWGLSVLAMFHGGAAWAQKDFPTGHLATQILETFIQHNNRAEHNADEAMKGIPLMPKGVANLLRQCFQQNPEDRPKTMLDCANTLIQVYESETGQTYPRPKPRPAEMLADGLNNQALSFLDLGKPEKAEQLFDEALRLHPDHPLATYNRGLVLWRAGRTDDDRILAQLHGSEQSMPNNSQVALCQGWIEWERGDFAVAAEHLNKAVQLGGGVEAQNAHAMVEAQRANSACCVRTFEGHTLTVTSICLTADGRLALSGNGYLEGSKKNVLKLWDLATGRCIRTFKGHTSRVNCVFLSRNGCWALSGSGDPNNFLERLQKQGRVSPNFETSKDRTLRLWDVGTGRCIRKFEGHHAEVTSVCLSVDNRWALSGSTDHTLRLWDLATGQCLQIFNGHEYEVTSVCLSTDGRWALSGSADCTIKLWDVATGQCLRTFNGHESMVNSVCISADSRVALSAGGTALKLWDVATGFCTRTFEKHTSIVESVCLSADGGWALSGSGDKTLKLWEVASGRCIRTFKGHTSGVQCVFLSADALWAMSGSFMKELKLWALEGAVSRNRPCAPFIYSRGVTVQETADVYSAIEIAIRKGNTLLQEGCAGAALEILRKVRYLRGAERIPALLDLWHKAGSHLQRKGLLAVWSSRTFEGHSDSVTSVCLSGDHRLALSGSADTTLKLWDVAAGHCLRTFQGHDHGVNSVCLSGDGRFVLSGSYDKTLKLWDVATGHCLRTFGGHSSGVRSVCLSADGRQALSGSLDDTLRLWDVETGQCLRTFGGHSSGVRSVCLSADGRWALSAGGDRTLKLWDVTTGHSIRTFKGCMGTLESVCLSTDGRWAFSGSYDVEQRLWEVATGRCVRTFKGHTSAVASVCLSAEGSLALSGSQDKTTKLWDVATGQCLWTFEGHSDAVESVCLSSDERRALSGSADGTLMLWELDWDYEPLSPEEEAQQRREQEARKRNSLWGKVIGFLGTKRR
jgi:WD40 repeat protein/serine/threonine protein kinase